MDCISIAGDYNAPVEIAGRNENMAISIGIDCKFASKSPSTGESYGKLRPVGDSSSYYGTGKTKACSSGNFMVYVEGSIWTGISFSAKCN